MSVDTGPLCNAVLADNRNRVQALIESGAPPSERNQALLVAVAAANFDMAATLLQLGAHISDHHWNSLPVLHALVADVLRIQPSCNVASVRGVVRSGTAPPHSTLQQDVPADDAAVTSRAHDIRAIIAALLQHDAVPLDERCTGGTTPLGTAVLVGRSDIVEVLLRAGADAAALQGSHGLTPLMLAACGADESTFDVLVQSWSARIKAVDAGSSSAAKWALYFGQWHRVACLCAYGCPLSRSEAGAAVHPSSVEHLQPRSAAQHFMRLLQEHQTTADDPEVCKTPLALLPASVWQDALVVALQLQARCRSIAPLHSARNVSYGTSTAFARSQKRQQARRCQQQQLQAAVQQLLYVEQVNRNGHAYPSVHSAMTPNAAGFAANAAEALLPAQRPWVTQDMGREWARCMRIMS